MCLTILPKVTVSEGLGHLLHESIALLPFLETLISHPVSLMIGATTCSRSLSDNPFSFAFKHPIDDKVDKILESGMEVSVELRTQEADVFGKVLADKMDITPSEFKE